MANYPVFFLWKTALSCYWADFNKTLQNRNVEYLGWKATNQNSCSLILPFFLLEKLTEQVGRRKSKCLQGSPV
jgi:hypothetical protein